MSVRKLGDLSDEELVGLYANLTGTSMDMMAVQHPDVWSLIAPPNPTRSEIEARMLDAWGSELVEEIIAEMGEEA